MLSVQHATDHHPFLLRDRKHVAGIFIPVVGRLSSRRGQRLARIKAHVCLKMVLIRHVMSQIGPVRSKAHVRYEPRIFVWH